MKVEKRSDEAGRGGLGTETFHICDVCGKPAIYSITGTDIFVNNHCPSGERTVDICKSCYAASDNKRDFSKRPVILDPKIQKAIKQEKQKKK